MLRHQQVKLQIPSTKVQINPKFQYSMFKTFGILNFGHWDLFDICDLRFGIYLLMPTHIDGELYVI